MNNDTPFTKDELEVSEDIMRFALRKAADDFSFLKNPIFTLKAVPTDETESIGADYSKLYYNSKWAIEQFRRSKDKLVNAVVHCVLHCLYLHPSMISEDNDIFDAAADMAILIMMHNAGAVKLNVRDNTINNIVNTCGSTSTIDIFNAAQKDALFLNKICNLVSCHKWDDHKVWYIKDEDKKKDEQKNEQKDENNQSGEGQDGAETGDIRETRASVSEGDGSGKDGEASSAPASGQAGPDMGEADWSAMLVTAKASAKSSSYGSQHGNMFMEIKKPDRFSRFSYKEYLRRFALTEVVKEDPETIDLMMYSAGFDMYGDVTLVEFSEISEQATASDIIIAIDISGSCGGDVAVNFLRQVYSLFAEMDIKSNVNIHAVTFDTQIVSKAVIRNGRDAKSLIENYNDHTRGGWGGTDFRCVFDYADNFRKENRGRKLRGLFFFSDGCGAFPDTKTKYRTTFFIPTENEPGFGYGLSFIPEWVECVKYDDSKN